MHPKHLAFLLGKLDLMYVDNVHDIQLIWAAQRNLPLLEGRHDACGCMDCIKRLYFLKEVTNDTPTENSVGRPKGPLSR